MSSRIGFLARLVGLVAALALTASAGAAPALATYGDEYGVAASQGAVPGSKAFYAGTCDLTSPATAFGVAPANPRECLAEGTIGNVGSSPNAWAQPPLWRLAPISQAGAHPDATAALMVRRDITNQSGSGGGTGFPAGSTRDVMVSLPPGVVGDPSAVPKCSNADFENSPPTCPPAAQVGVLTTRYSFLGITQITKITPVYNLQPLPGKAVEFGLPDVASLAALRVEGEARTDGDFGVDTGVDRLPTGLPLFGQSLTFWGVPWAASNDRFRTRADYPLNMGEATMPATGLLPVDQAHYDPSWGPIKSFISLQTECDGSSPTTTLNIDSWQKPGAERPNGTPDTTDPNWHTTDSASPPMTGCDKLQFDPAISLDPVAAGGGKSEAADSPTGLDVELSLPQNDELPFDPPAVGAGQPEIDQYNSEATAFWKSDAGLATSHLRDTEVVLPEGLSLNPAAADGLQACTLSQIGFLTAAGDEVQRISLPSRQNAPFVFSFEGSDSSSLPANAGAAEVAAAFEGLPGLGSGSVAVSGEAGGPWTVRFTGPMAGRDVPPIGGRQANGETQELTVNATGGTFKLSFEGQSTGATGSGDTTSGSKEVVNVNTATGQFVVGAGISGPGIAANATIAAVGAGTLTLSANATATAAGVALASDLRFNSTAAVVQAALEALPAIAPGDVTVSGGPGNNGGTSPYLVAFGGSFAGTDVPELTATGTLTGGGASASVLTSVLSNRDLVVATAEPGGAMHFDRSEPGCPDGSKIGTVAIETPLLPEADWPQGHVYLAAQGANPFGSDFAMYLVAASPVRNLLIKLAGRVDADPVTGRLRTTFTGNPQLPFDKLRLHFKSGPRAPLATPRTCGTFVSSTELTSYSDPGNPVLIEDPFAIASSPAGGCPANEAARPFAPGFEAGSGSPLAGSSSPFTVRLTRGDGNQELDRIELTAPDGLSARLAGVPYCPEAGIAQAAARTGSGDGELERNNPSCPAASQVGTTTIGAGAGSAPFHVSGKVYLAGPYKGAPISLAFVVPAVAGPFDLGVQVVRAALHVNPRTAQVTAVSDTIPKILDGIPLRIRSVRVDLDRGDFVVNPTDCSEQAVTARAFGANGTTADLTNRYQLAGCDRLAFKPGLSLRFFGGVKRSAYQRLRAEVVARPGDANIARAAVTLPRSAFLAQEHIRTVCTRVQFAARACPEGSIYGQATAVTPLLDQPLSGPVYLRSSDNTLPDLVAALRGPDSQPIEVELAGRIDSVKGGLRNTFELVPDVPVTRFVLEMKGGKKSLIVNSRDFCTSAQRATVRLEAQNGRRHDFRPKVVNPRCAKARKGRKR